MSRRRNPPFWIALGIAALASAQGFRESVRVGLVTVRLDVRGDDGRPLQDLKASEVKLKVDGKEVSIEGLDRVESAAPPAVPKPAESAPAPAPAPAPPEIAGAPAAAAPPSPELYLAILVDETSTNSFDRRDVNRQINRKSKARRLSAEESAPFGDAIQLGLPPGPYTWSVALKDIPSGMTSYLVVRKVL
jgi:hypothetical protein